MNFDETRPVQDQEQPATVMPAGWELVLRGPQGEHRIPVNKSLLRLSPKQTAGPEIKLHLQKGHLAFQATPPLKLGELPASLGELHPGQSLTWEAHRLTLVDSRALASLQCYSEPYDDRIWMLGDETLLVGRTGQRENQICLDHPTVSRTHARLQWRSQSAFLLCQSSKGRTRVGGQDLSLDQEVELKDGALIDFGELVLRFRSLGRPEDTCEGLIATSLGGFTVQMGSTLILEKSWRTQNARWLLARLALDWAKPVATEQICDLFWPEAAPDKARNSLNFVLSSLRALLGSDLIVRNSQALQLNPARLLRHDCIVLRGCLDDGKKFRASGRQESALAQFSQVLQLYTGPYLQGCYLDWALVVRTTLEEEVLEVGRYLLSELRNQGRLEEVADCAQRILRHDVCCQQSSAALMASHTDRGHPQEALKVYEASLKSLQRELGVEPAIDVLREYHRALAFL